jgi:hypothetical protein
LKLAVGELTSGGFVIVLEIAWRVKSDLIGGRL